MKINIFSRALFIEDYFENFVNFYTKTVKPQF